ncbi:MAG: hypothetical protein HYZ66_08110, partial [Chlamydiae bacterium]|nr:hypothetical protein [Chlamydiota bacterium]
MRSFCQKTLKLVLIASLFFHDVYISLAETSWTSLSLSSESSRVKTPSLKILSSTNEFQNPFKLPCNVGEVIESDFKTGQPNIFLIEDIHCNSEVQKNVTRILQILKTQLEARSSRLEAKAETQLEARSS